MPWPADELQGHPYLSAVSVLHQDPATGQALVIARNRITNALVTLKFSERQQVCSSGLEQQLLHWMRLRHPHIVSLNEVFITKSFVVLVLDHSEPASLAGLVPPRKGLPESKARWLFQQVVFAIEYAHRMGVAIRSTRLENILVSLTGPRPLVKLADFDMSMWCSGGCSSGRGASGGKPAVGAQHACASQGIGCGDEEPSPMYVAPEGLDGNHKPQGYDPQKVDVWSCGVLLYFLVTGTYPFLEPADVVLSPRERMIAMLQRMQEAVFDLPPWLSKNCKELICSMLQTDPRARPTIQAVLLHPWCCEGPEAMAMLQLNDFMFSRSIKSLPSTELVHELGNLLLEASRGAAV